MVQEFRRIMLDENELVGAMDGFRRLTPGFLPDGKIIKCVPTTESIESVKVTLEVTNETGVTQIEHTVKDVDVGKCLVRFCLENNIMLPKDGRKGVAVVGGYVSLCIALDLSVDQPEHIAPLQCSNIRSLSPGDIVRGKHVIRAR
ncbi:MAG: hypothetical protein WAO98_07785 [Alphaproteobacteria bacterium]